MSSRSRGSRLVNSAAQCFVAPRPRRSDDPPVRIPPIHPAADDVLGMYFVDAPNAGLSDHRPRDLESMSVPGILSEEEARFERPWEAPRVRYVSGWEYNPTTIAQLGLGDHTRYLSTGDERFRAAVMSAADWLVAHQGEDGSWRVGFGYEELAPGWMSGMYQGQCASLLSRAADLSADSVYLEHAGRGIESMLRPLEEGGALSCFDDGRPVVEEYPGTAHTRHVLNGAIFAVWGVRDVAVASGERVLAGRWLELAESLAGHLDCYDTGAWSQYALPVGGLRRPAPARYHALHIAQLRVMGSMTADRRWAGMAERWTTYLDDWLRPA